jgi:hypothetical protein
VQLQYGYNRSSNRTYRKDLVTQGAGQDLDELYLYDGLNQLKKFHRGLLVDDNTAIASPGLQQGWDFDATGNWKNFTQFDPADADQTIDQQRVHNRANEITQIARTVGANWTTPSYDRNGKMTGLPKGIYLPKYLYPPKYLYGELCVPNRILVAVVAELRLQGFGAVEVLFAELLRILEEDAPAPSCSSKSSPTATSERVC